MSGRSQFVFVRNFGFFLSYTAVGMEAGAILPLGPLNTDTALRTSGDPDAEVSGRYHSNGYPTMDISTCPGVGLPPLGGEAAIQALQYDLSLSE